MRVKQAARKKVGGFSLQQRLQFKRCDITYHTNMAIESEAKAQEHHQAAKSEEDGKKARWHRQQARACLKDAMDLWRQVDELREQELELVARMQPVHA